MQKSILLRPTPITHTTISTPTTVSTPTATSQNNTEKNHNLTHVLSLLSILTWLLSTATIVIISCALSTNFWLHISENADTNGALFNYKHERNIIRRQIIFGLWSVCSASKSTVSRNYECMKINMFKENLQNNLNDSTTNAIINVIRKSIYFFLIATILLSLGYLFLIVGNCLKNRRIYIFFAGVTFVKSGLVMLFGIIMYISLFKHQLQLNTQSETRSQTYSYQYGNSFLLYVMGFIGVEVSGVAAIFLFIHHNRIYSITQKRQFFCSNGRLRLSPVLHNHFHSRNYINSLQNVKIDPLLSQRLNGICNVHGGPKVKGQSISYQSDNHFMQRDITTNTVSTMADLPYDDGCGNMGCSNINIAESDLPQEFITFNLNKTLNRKKINIPNSIRKTTPV